LKAFGDSKSVERDLGWNLSLVTLEISVSIEIVLFYRLPRRYFPLRLAEIKAVATYPLEGRY